MVDEEALLEPSAGIAAQAEVCAIAFRHDVARDVATELETGAITFDDAIRAGILRQLLLYAKGFDLVGVGTPTPFEDAICVGELHCPNIAGAAAKWTSRSEHGDSIGLELKAEGIAGGGWTSARAYCGTSEIPTTHGHCLGLYVNVKGEYLLWQHQDEPNRYLVMTNIYSIGQFVSSGAIRNQQSDICGADDMYDRWNAEIAGPWLVETKDFEQCSVLAGGEPIKQTGIWKREREYSVSLGFSVPVGSVSVGSAAFSLKSRFLREIAVETTFPAGHHYIGRYAGRTALPLRWAVSP